MKLKWKRPHLTYFGTVEIRPGVNDLTADQAKTVTEHWSYADQVKAGNVEEVAEAAKPAPKAAEAEEKADAKKGEKKTDKGAKAA
ncbi:MAG TPA: hypothetical protein VFT43_09575 [Candidatus Polarisedimenticolia bacterium]|nr:hypothetical protein [Candidatus Polarisedimenticolia bacterium]